MSNFKSNSINSDVNRLSTLNSKVNYNLKVNNAIEREQIYLKLE